MASNENQVQEHEPIEDLDTDSNEDQDNESVEDSDAEQTPRNKTFRIGCMTFCLAVTVLFLWVWHHQTQFNDNYRKASFLMNNDEPEKAIEAYQKAIKNKIAPFSSRTPHLLTTTLGKPICRHRNFHKPLKPSKK